MKKFLALFLILFALPINVCADNINLDFHPISNAKFIYCNNPEFITKNDLADSTFNDSPTLLMKQNLNPGEYNLFVSLRNMISKVDLSDRTQLHIDVEFCNNGPENLVIKINKLGWQIPQSQMQSEPLSPYRNDISWSCLNAYSDYFQKKFDASDYIQDGKYEFETHLPKPLPQIFENNIIIKPGEKFWLLGDSHASRPAMFVGQVFLLLSNFEIVSGDALAKIAAFVDINNYDENAQDGKFITEIRDGVKSYRFYKGIADSSTILQTNLEYDINEDLESNIPVAINNQVTNDYTLTEKWVTNFNPYACKNLASIISESDMFKFEYHDEKLWHFDTSHTDLPNEFVAENSTSFCNLGNWGATNRYNIKLNNQTDSDYRLEYYLQTDSDVIVISDDTVRIKSHVDTTENFPVELKRYYKNSKTIYAKKNPLCVLKSEPPTQKIIDFLIKPNESKTVTFDVTLCTNCDGKLINSLQLVRCQ